MDAESHVDAMITEGRRITDEAIAAVKPFAVAAAFSGGGDSIVATHFAMTNYSGCVVFNADTMIGLAPARRHIEQVIESPPCGNRTGSPSRRLDPKRRPTPACTRPGSPPRFARRPGDSIRRVRGAVFDRASGD